MWISISANRAVRYKSTEDIMYDVYRLCGEIVYTAEVYVTMCGASSELYRGSSLFV